MSLPGAQDLALKLMDEHGLSDWNFQFDNAVKRFGLTNFKTKTISLSTKLTELNDELHVKDTILHEIAHALVGQNNGHNYVWRIKARSIGCNGSRLYNSAIVKQPEMNYTATCPNGHVSKRVKKPRRGREIACGICCRQYNYGRFSRAYLFTYVRN